MSTNIKTRPIWVDGAAARGETEILLDEVRDLRDLLWGVIMLLGTPADQVYQHKFAGARANRSDREKGLGVVPLRDLPLSGKAEEEAAYRYDIVTLQDLVRHVRRSEVASWPGMGKVRMSKLDDAVAAAGHSWAPES